MKNTEWWIYWDAECDLYGIEWKPLQRDSLLMLKRGRKRLSQESANQEILNAEITESTERYATRARVL